MLNVTTFWTVFLMVRNTLWLSFNRQKHRTHCPHVSNRPKHGVKMSAWTAAGAGSWPSGSLMDILPGLSFSLMALRLVMVSRQTGKHSSSLWNPGDSSINSPIILQLVDFKSCQVEFQLRFVSANFTSVVVWSWPLILAKWWGEKSTHHVWRLPKDSFGLRVFRDMDMEKALEEWNLVQVGWNWYLWCGHSLPCRCGFRICAETHSEHLQRR